MQFQRRKKREDTEMTTLTRMLERAGDAQRSGLYWTDFPSKGKLALKIRKLARSEVREDLIAMRSSLEPPVSVRTTSKRSLDKDASSPIGKPKRSKRGASVPVLGRQSSSDSTQSAESASELSKGLNSVSSASVAVMNGSEALDTCSSSSEQGSLLNNSREDSRAEKTSSVESEEPVYCVCRGIDDGSLMVECEGCREWFHARCIGEEQVWTQPVFFCDACKSLGMQPEASSDQVSLFSEVSHDEDAGMNRLVPSIMV